MDQDRRSPTRFGRTVVSSGVLAAGTALVLAAGANAAPDPEPPGPPPPADSAPAAPPALDPGSGLTPTSPFSTYAFGMPGSGQELLLGQTATPAVVGTAPAAVPSADVFNAAQLLMPQNYRVPPPNQDSPYALTQGTPPGPFARVDALKGVHAMVHGALGRMPADQLGQPLAGTAPPPGVNIPAGPEQFLPDPVPPAPAPGTVPAAPGAAPAPAAPLPPPA